MATNSYKNILQEFCQKNKYSMPIYKTTSYGLPHALQWSSVVTLTIGERNYRTASNNSATKIQAEQQAARTLHEQLLNAVPKESPRESPKKLRAQSNMIPILVPVVTLNDSHKESPKESGIKSKLDLNNLSKIYLIDLENKPCMGKLLESQTSLYIGFLSSTHHSIPKYTGWHLSDTDNIKQLLETNNVNKLLYTVEGGLTDLVDHNITMFIYPLLQFIRQLNKAVEVIIVSGDNAGWCSTACLRTAIRWQDIQLISRVTNSIRVE